MSEPTDDIPDALLRVLKAASEVWGSRRVADVARRLADLGERPATPNPRVAFVATRCGGSPQHYTGECDCP